jgi:hypothetical protein
MLCRCVQSGREAPVRLPPWPPASSCCKGVANNYNVSLTLYSYDGFDNLCTDPYETATVQPGYNTNGGAFDRAVPLTRLGGTPKPAS